MQRAAVERCPGRLLCSTGNPALLLHSWSPPGLSSSLLQHKQVRPTSSWKLNPASQTCTQISSCPAGNGDGEFAAPGGPEQSLFMGAGEGQEWNTQH